MPTPTKPALLNQMHARLSPWERAGFLSSLKKCNRPEEMVEGDDDQWMPEDNQVIKLVTLITERPDISREELMEAFYDMPKRNALDAIRKRAIKKLKQYLVSLMSDPEKSPLGAILTDIVVAEFFRMRQAEVPVKHFISSAENRAEQHRHYDLLDGIYSYHTRHEGILKTPREQLAKKRKANAPLFEKKRKLELANADIQLELDRAKLAGESLDPEQIIKQVLDKLKLTKEETNIPEFQLSTMHILRSGMISAKVYFQFEPVVLAHYETLKAANAFQNGSVEAELGFLYMIAQAHMRNRKFDLLNERLNEMHPLLQKGFWSQTIYYPKYISLKARAESARGENKQGIQTLAQGLAQLSESNFVKERLNMELNKVVFHFHEEEFRKAKQLLYQIDQNYPGLYGTMGEEWCFKKELILLIVLHELEEFEPAISQLLRIRKSYADFLKRSEYGHAKLFLDLIAKVVREPKVVEKKSFRQRVRKAMENFETQEHDLQAVTFFCWLKCKIQKRTYYSVLLEELNTEGDRFKIEKVLVKKQEGKSAVKKKSPKRA